MNSLNKYFPSSKKIPIDKFISNALYNKDCGYYSKKILLEKMVILLLHLEYLHYLVSLVALMDYFSWEHMDKPKTFNIVELGPGNGQMCKTFLRVFKKFPIFFNSVNIFLYEKSKTLENLQKIIK